MIKSLQNVISFLTHRNTAQVVTLGYVIITLIGSFFLSLPFAQKIPSSYIDHLFIATSAISTTGLTTVSVWDNYTLFGQLIIALLIQIGGIGYMTLASFVVMMGTKKITPVNKMLIRSQFGLPDDFNLYKFVPAVIQFSFITEFIGAVCLYFIFAHHGVVQPLWSAVFHSISAFCTAGFSLYNNNFENFYHDTGLNILISVLSYVGAMGFILAIDVWESWVVRRRPHITYTSEIIIVFTLILGVLGTVDIFFTEPSISQFSFSDRLWASIFQSMSAFTTVGFNTIPIAKLSHSVLYLLVVLMIIGSSPAGTGGGIKSTTVVAIYAQIIAAFKGRKEVIFLGRKIPDYRIHLANAAFSLYFMVLCIGVYLLTITETTPVFDLFFEAASALGTVGLSMGITANLTFWGKCIISALMFIGRAGPLSFGISFFFNQSAAKEVFKEEDVII